MEIFKRHKSGVSNQNDGNTLTVPKPSSGKPVNDADCKQFGFVNFGNTCYANSILQALYFCKPFRQFVCEFNDGSLPLPLPAPVPPTPAPPATPLPKPPGLSPFPFRRRESTINAGRVDDHSSTPPKTNVSTPASTSTIPPTLFSALRSLFLHITLNPTDKGTVSPTSFIDKVKEENPAYRSAMHQDAHEFLGFLLNRVAENIKEVMKKNPPHAEANGHANGSTELSSSLGSLPGPSSVTNSSGSGRHWKTGDTFIQDLFEGTLSSETRCLTCENVSSRDESFLDLSIDIEQNCSITACLRQFSASEMLAQKNKFFCDACGSLQEAEKRMKIKRLPNVLALHLKRFKYQEDRYVKLSYRVPFPFELRLFNTVDDAPDPDRLYSLFAVVVHIGVGAHHGHYITIIKSRGTWYTFDDETVQPIKEGDMAKYFGGTGGESGYVLFYQAADLEAAEPAPPPDASIAARDGSITAVSIPPTDANAQAQALAISTPADVSTDSEPFIPIIRPPDTMSNPRAMPITLKLTVPNQPSVGVSLSPTTDASKAVTESDVTTPTATSSKTPFSALRSASFSRKKRPKSSGFDGNEQGHEVPGGSISSPYRSKSSLFSSSTKKSEKSSNVPPPPPLPPSVVNHDTSAPPSATTTSIGGTEGTSNHVKESTTDSAVVGSVNGTKDSSSIPSVSVSASVSSVSVAIPNHNSTADVSEQLLPSAPSIPSPPSAAPTEAEVKDQSSVADGTASASPPNSLADPEALSTLQPPPSSPPSSLPKRWKSARPSTSPSSLSSPDSFNKAPSKPPPPVPIPTIPSTSTGKTTLRSRSFSASNSLPTVGRSGSHSSSDASARQSMPPTNIVISSSAPPPPIPERSPHRSGADKSDDKPAADKSSDKVPKPKSKRKRFQELLGFGH